MKTNFGFIRVLPYAIFQNPDAGLTREELAESRNAEFEDGGKSVPPPNFNDWLPVKAAKHRGDLFIVEGVGAGSWAMLQFSSQQPDAGDYKIRRGLRSQTEKGRTYHVREIRPDETDFRISRLLQFPIRFLVFTTADDRAKTRNAWLVGLEVAEEVREDAV